MERLKLVCLRVVEWNAKRNVSTIIGHWKAKGQKEEAGGGKKRKRKPKVSVWARLERKRRQPKKRTHIHWITPIPFWLLTRTFLDNAAIDVGRQGKSCLFYIDIG